jgi:hypothetical protein
LPLPLTNASPYWVHRGLAPPSVCALPGAHKKMRVHYDTLIFILCTVY